MNIKDKIVKSNVTQGKEAVERMLAGMKVATNLVIRPTYGHGGCNATIESEFEPFHMVANDAFTMVEAIHVEGAVEKRGLNILKEVVKKANKDSRDGRKTTAIIAEEILERSINSGIPYMELKARLDSYIPIIEKEIDQQKKEITLEDVHKVARIASESESIGKIIGEIYQKVGKDGIIDVQGSGTYETSYDFIDGIRFEDAGFLSPYMVHDEAAVKEKRAETKAVYENPYILVTKRKINHINDINPLLKSMEAGSKKDLVIFTDDMDSGVASTLVDAHKAHVFNILIIKAPILWKNWVFEDFARVTGSTIVEDASGVNFKNLKLSHLGTCAKITTDKDETTIIGGQDLSGHVRQLREKGDNDSLIRLKWLTTKSAVLKIGANSESELSYLRLKAEDGVNASRLALLDDGGVVEGGGVALAKIELDSSKVGRIVHHAMSAPYLQICKNANVNPVVNNFGPDVIDSAKVVKNAVRNAIGLASTILTAPIDIALPIKTPEQIAYEALKGKGMRF